LGTISGKGSLGAFEPSGQEPELPGFNASQTPMLGGTRRQWPSLAAYLLSEQHKAHRTWDMNRVWVMRRLRYRLQQRLDAEREASLTSGESVQAITDQTALDEILAERIEVKESVDQAMSWRRYKVADEHRAILAIVDEVVDLWQPKMIGEMLDTDGQSK
jgi:hypothetical protein